MPGFTCNPKLAAPAKKLALANIEKGHHGPRRCAREGDAELPDRLQADPDLQRLLPRARAPTTSTSSPTGSRRSPPTRIVTADGAERAIDVIIVATGFYTTEQPIAEHIKGRDGRTLADAWARQRDGGVQGHHRSRGFPNLFQIVGAQHRPGPLLHGVHHREPDRLHPSRAPEDGRPTASPRVEPRPEAQEAWNDDMQRRMQRTVWNTGGCASWYLDAHGRNTTLWPRTTFKFRALLVELRPRQYVVDRRHRGAAPRPSRPGDAA